MHIEVLLEWFSMSEAFTTILTVEPSLPRVSTHVVFQMRGLHIFLSTNLTFVRFVAIMRFLVALKIAHIFVFLFANFTSERFLI